MNYDLCHAIPLHPAHIVDIFRRRWREVQTMVKLAKGPEDLDWLLRQQEEHDSRQIPSNLSCYSLELLIVQFRCDVFVTIKTDIHQRKKIGVMTLASLFGTFSKLRSRLLHQVASQQARSALLRPVSSAV